MSQELMDPSLEKCGERSESEGKKLCTECKTAKTPMWRIGPHGPKSLCNACGIKFRKKSGGGGCTFKGLNKESSDNKKENPSPASSSTTTAAAAAITTGKKGKDGVNRFNNGKLGSKLKVKLMCLGREVVLLKRPRSPMKRRKSCKKLGEVEQAAVLLMAMSCDSVYA